MSEQRVKASVRVAEILNNLQTEEPVNTADMNVPDINTIILLDREVDMVTPMLSQLTYEGLLDEFLHIDNAAVEVDAGKKAKVPLNSSEKLFKEIRDLNFEVVVQLDMEQRLVESESYDIPNDAAYVYSGYAPLSIRLIQQAIRSGCVADSRRASVLVVFIGGETFAEIAALRFLSSREGKAISAIHSTGLVQ